MTGWAEKVEKEKEEKKQREGFPVGFLGPRGGRREGRGCAARKGPPGQVPSALPPFPFSPSLPPEGGRTPDPISIELYRHISFAIRFSEMAKPSLRLCIRLMANGECKISNFHYSIIDYLLNGWVDSKMLSPIPKTSIGAKTIFLFKKNASQIGSTTFLFVKAFSWQHKSHINLKNRNFLLFYYRVIKQFNDVIF